MTETPEFHVTGMLDDQQTAALNDLLERVSSQQALWISGYIAGLHATRQPPAAKTETAPSGAATITIVYASETGNARALSDTFSQALAAEKYSTRVCGMDEYPVRDLKNESCLIVIASTHGEGDPPDNARDFYEYLHGRKAPKLDGLKYAVLGLGDSSYEYFCQAGKDVDKRLAELGAKRLHERVDCDVDYETPADAWMKALLPELKPFQAAAGGSSAPAVNSKPAPARSAYSKKHPYPAPLLDRIDLNGRGSDKQTLHVEFSLEDSGIEYAPGDALGVFPKNPSDAVRRLCDVLDLRADTPVDTNNRELPLQQWLTDELDITTVTRGLLEQWARWSGSDELRDILADNKTTFEFCSGHHVEDLARRYPAAGLEAARLIEVLRPMQPRLYSIASSQAAYPDEVHLTVAKVAYRLHGRECAGIASGFLAGCDLGTPVHTYVQPNPDFKLPADPDTPVIMIGAGTGVAPYRGFLQSLEAGGTNRRSWLLFGDRPFRTDFLYQTEWQRYLKTGVLNRMDVAFSRDREEKVYVQHRMLEQAAALYAWLEDGAVLYVCGDAKRLAPDVRAALKQIVRRQRGCHADEAEAYLKELRRNKRYLQDVY